MIAKILRKLASICALSIAAIVSTLAPAAAQTDEIQVYTSAIPSFLHDGEGLI